LKHLRALLPFIVVAATAAAMSFAQFAPLSTAVRRMFSVLALSRFPGADYREFFYLGILLLLLAGLSESMQPDFSPWKKTALALVVLIFFALLSLGFIQHDLSPNSLKPFLSLVKQMTWFGLATVAILYAGSSLRKPGIVGLVLPVSIVLTMMPVIAGAKVYWSDPDALKNAYETQGLPVAKVNAALRSLSVFHRHETSRPARKTAGDPAWLSWRGYLDGSYMTNDVGGVVSLSRARIEASPVLFRLMHEPSKLLRIDCGVSARACAGDPNGVVTGSLGIAGRSLEYSRDYVVYDVDVPARSLVVENEVYIAGWHAVCDGKSLQVQRVDGSLRGWVVPAGHHRVRVYYQTPLLVPGSIVSIVAGLAAVLSFAWFTRLPSQN
jgi:Bacterial membrane protein YfhO